MAVLASKGAKVYLGARSPEKFNEAVKDIHASHPPTKNSPIEFLQVNLSTANGAKSAAEAFKSSVLVEL